MHTSVAQSNTVQCSFSKSENLLTIEANMYDDIKSLKYFAENWSKFKARISILDKSVIYQSENYKLIVSEDFSKILCLYGSALACRYDPDKPVRFFEYSDFVLAKIGPYEFSTTHQSYKYMLAHGQVPSLKYLSYFNGLHVDKEFDTYRADRPYIPAVRYEYLRKWLDVVSSQFCTLTKLI